MDINGLFTGTGMRDVFERGDNNNGNNELLFMAEFTDRAPVCIQKAPMAVVSSKYSVLVRLGINWKMFSGLNVIKPSQY